MKNIVKQDKKSDITFQNTKKMEVKNPEKLEGLKTYLENAPLEVPIYQREYSWELEQVSDLYHDIDNSNEDSPLYLGSFLFYSSDNKVEIIDGQQRLTTIFLIMYCIKERIEEWFTTIENPDEDTRTRYRTNVDRVTNFIYKKSGKGWDVTKTKELYLTTGRRDRDLFKSILQNADFAKQKDGRRKSHKLLLNAYNFINNKTKSAGEIKKLIEYLDKINDCLYIAMKTTQKEDQKMLFKTLNSRGIALSESDLIKNEICTKIKSASDSKDEIESAVSIWDEMRETIESPKANVDLFLFHYINQLEDALDIRKHLDKRSSYSTDQDNLSPFISEKMVFSAYEYKIATTTDINRFLNDLKEKAEYYSEFYKPQKLSVPYTTYLEGLRAMNLTKCYPLLLRGREKLSIKNFERLTKAIEAISLKHSILSKEPKDLEKFYYQDLLRKLQSDKDIDDIINKIKSHSSLTEENRFEELFCSAAPKFGRMIIKRIIQSSKDEMLDFSPSVLTFEHIMPQTVKGEWKILKESNEDLYDEYLNRLGNLTFIKYDKNIGASNRDFVDKKEYYKNSIPFNKSLLDYPKWDFEEIDNRQKYLYSLAKEIWKI